jgi:hypothetical protein
MRGRAPPPHRRHHSRARGQAAHRARRAQAAAARSQPADGGRCVASSAVMLRALEYARNFDLLIIQHAEDAELYTGAAMHEGEVSARLGLRGWPRVARTRSSPVTCSSPSTPGRATTRRTSPPPARSDPARGQAARRPRHLRGDAPPPAAHGRGGARLRHRLQGEPPAAGGRGRRPRSAMPWPTGPSTSSPRTRAALGAGRRTASSRRAASGMIGIELALGLMLAWSGTAR